MKLNPPTQEINDNFHKELIANPGETIESWIRRSSESFAGSLDWAQLDPNLRISAVFKPRDEARINALRTRYGRDPKAFADPEPPEFRTYIRFDIDPYDVAEASNPGGLKATLLANQRTRVDSISIGGVIVDGGAILDGDNINGVPINSGMKHEFFDFPAADGIGIGIEHVQSNCDQAVGKRNLVRRCRAGLVAAAF